MITVKDLHEMLRLAMKMGVNPDSPICLANTTKGEWVSLDFIMTPDLSADGMDDFLGYSWLTLYPGRELNPQLDAPEHRKEVN